MGGAVPEVRIRRVNRAPIRDRGYVLYWMIAARRRRYNAALQRARELAEERGAPLVILEALRAAYPFASDRLHAFVIDGMIENARSFAASPARYLAYLEPEPGDGSGLLAALAARACAVVTDDFPHFFLPRMIAAAGRDLDVRLEAVDGNGLYPMRATDRAFTTAASFRRHLQRDLPEHLWFRPRPDSLARLDVPRAVVPAAVLRRWPAVNLEAARADLGRFPIDHDIAPARRGGHRAASRRLTRVLEERLERYGERNHPDERVTSGLSPYLHFGHIGAHEIFARLVAREGWSPDRLGPEPTGRRTGWWGASESAETFLDQLITWRELGFNAAAHLDGYDRYESLPAWARQTLELHVPDPRPAIYGARELAAAATDDPLWNAAQRQLLRDGVIHNYLRMLWGKRIIEWTPDPGTALEVMLELNDRYAIDGRDPNSISGIFWVLGRYDRGWPERPIFGKVRSMTSASARRKLHLEGYLERYSELA